MKTGATQKKDAEQLLVDMLKKINDGSYSEPTKMTVGKYFDKWLQDYALHKVRKSTYDSYQWAMGRATAFETRISHLTADQLETSGY